MKWKKYVCPTAKRIKKILSAEEDMKGTYLNRATRHKILLLGHVYCPWPPFEEKKETFSGSTDPEIRVCLVKWYNGTVAQWQNGTMDSTVVKRRKHVELSFGRLSAGVGPTSTTCSVHVPKHAHCETTLFEQIHDGPWKEECPAFFLYRIIKFFFSPPAQWK